MASSSLSQPVFAGDMQSKRHVDGSDVEGTQKAARLETMRARLSPVKGVFSALTSPGAARPGALHVSGASPIDSSLAPSLSISHSLLPPLPSHPSRSRVSEPSVRLIFPRAIEVHSAHSSPHLASLFRVS